MLVAVLRTFTRANAFLLAASLLLAELFTAIVIVYTYGCPTLFQAFASENRTYVLIHLRGNFPLVEQWFIVTPWATGILLGEILARRAGSKVAGEQDKVLL